MLLLYKTDHREWEWDGKRQKERVCNLYEFY